MMIFIPCEPKALPRARVGKFGVYNPKWVKILKNQIRDEYIARSNVFYGDAPIKLSATFFISKPKSVKREYPSVKPDLDNYIKLICDALNGVAYKDDASIIKIEAEKLYSNTTGIFLKIELY